MKPQTQMIVTVPNIWHHQVSFSLMPIVDKVNSVLCKLLGPRICTDKPHSQVHLLLHFAVLLCDNLEY